MLNPYTDKVIRELEQTRDRTQLALETVSAKYTTAAKELAEQRGEVERLKAELADQLLNARATECLMWLQTIYPSGTERGNCLVDMTATAVEEIVKLRAALRRATELPLPKLADGTLNVDEIVRRCKEAAALLDQGESKNGNAADSKL